MKFTSFIVIEFQLYISRFSYKLKDNTDNIFIKPNDLIERNIHEHTDGMSC